MIWNFSRKCHISYFHYECKVLFGEMSYLVNRRYAGRIYLILYERIKIMTNVRVKVELEMIYSEIVMRLILGVFILFHSVTFWRHFLCMFTESVLPTTNHFDK